jgi:uridine kinase
VRTGIFDSFRDEPLPEQWVAVDPSSIVVIDGVLLLRPELAPHWDYAVWLDIDSETMVARSRARSRAAGWPGEEDEVEARCRARDVPMHELYESLAGPVERAHACIDNRDLAEPRILRLSHS